MQAIHLRSHTDPRRFREPPPSPPMTSADKKLEDAEGDAERIKQGNWRTFMAFGWFHIWFNMV